MRACLTGVLSGHVAIQATTQREARMSDKSPRQGMSKKSGKSIKEKRTEKRDKAAGNSASGMEKLTDKKR